MKTKYFLTILFAVAIFLCNAQEYKLEGNEVKIEKQVLFETGSAKLKTESAAALEIIKKYLDDKSYISMLRVECHIDKSGDETHNQKLTEQRAIGVCVALVKMGVDCKRLIAVGFGSQKPLQSNDTPEGKAANQRVGFINVALRGRLIGGLPEDGGGKPAGDVCTQ